jgi:hypothetical protein
MAQVERLHRPYLLEVQRGEAVAPGRAQVAAGALHPEDLDVRARERVLLDELRRGVAAPGVGEGQVLAELVRAIDEPVQAAEGTHFLLPPPALHLAHRARLLCHPLPFGHQPWHREYPRWEGPQSFEVLQPEALAVTLDQGVRVGEVPAFGQAVDRRVVHVDPDLVGTRPAAGP